MKSHAVRFGTLVVVLVAGLTLTGCGRVGPLSIDQGRLRYNDVIEQTTQTQLLLNLVRVSRNHPPVFIDVTEVFEHGDFRYRYRQEKRSVPDRKPHLRYFDTNGNLFGKPHDSLHTFTRSGLGSAIGGADCH